MPSGKIHYRLWRRSWWIAGAVASVGTVEILSKGMYSLLILPSCFLLGYGLGALIDPDLDLRTITEVEKRWQKIPFHFMFRIWWRLYAKLMSSLGGHRSFITHCPGVSSAIRMGWLILPFV